MSELSDSMSKSSGHNKTKYNLVVIIKRAAVSQGS